MGESRSDRRCRRAAAGAGGGRPIHLPREPHKLVAPVDPAIQCLCLFRVSAFWVALELLGPGDCADAGRVPVMSALTQQFTHLNQVAIRVPEKTANLTPPILLQGRREKTRSSAF